MARSLGPVVGVAPMILWLMWYCASCDRGGHDACGCAYRTAAPSVRPAALAASVLGFHFG
eukprot:12447724-Heterocapsa_arctica.AAC.1